MALCTVQAHESDKCYLSPKDLSITEQGIFMKRDDALISLSGVSYDYQQGSFYTEEQLARTELTRCGYCGRKTLDAATGRCYNPDCPYYPFYRELTR